MESRRPVLGLWKTFYLLQILFVLHLGSCELLAEEGDVRLVNPRDGKPREGIVMVYLEEEWQWISKEGFDQPTAAVLCRRAGFKGEAIADVETYMGPAALAKRLTCGGQEATPLDCTIQPTEHRMEFDSISYSADFDVWGNYTGAYVICNELEASPQIEETQERGSTSIVISIVLLVVVVTLVIVFACLFHRYILRREMAKMTISKPDDKDINMTAMQYTSLDLEAGPSSQERPATKESSFVGGDGDPAAADDPTYSREVYEEPKGGKAVDEEEYECPDEAKGKKEKSEDPENLYIECK